MTTREHLAAMARSRLETRRIYRQGLRFAREDMGATVGECMGLVERIGFLTEKVKEHIRDGRGLPKADA